MKRTEKSELFRSIIKIDKKQLLRIYNRFKRFNIKLKKDENLMKSIEKNIKKHEYTGLIINVLESDSTFKNIEGIVLAETRNTFKILTIDKNNSPEIKSVPKKGNDFGLFLNRKCFLAKGEEINYSPTERLKKL